MRRQPRAAAHSIPPLSAPRNSQVPRTRVTAAARFGFDAFAISRISFGSGRDEAPVASPSGERARRSEVPQSSEMYGRWRGQRPMFGRLPWFALERRRRALRLLVFFDIGLPCYGSRGRPPTAMQLNGQRRRSAIVARHQCNGGSQAHFGPNRGDPPPGCTASFGSLTRSGPSSAHAASRSSTLITSPQNSASPRS